MASAVDISNLALSLLGERAEVSSISPPEESAEAKLCGRFYPMARDELLELGTWTFATRRVVLAQVANDRPGWTYAYAVPSNCLKPRTVLAADALDAEIAEDGGDDFIVESGSTGAKLIYTNREAATLRYTVQLTDTTKFSALFTAALARLLAMKMAGTLIKGTAGMQVALQQEKLFMLEMATARAEDANIGNRNTAFRDRVPDVIRARGFRVAPYGNRR